MGSTFQSGWLGRSPRFFAAATLVFAVIACSQDTQGKAEELFDELDPPTFNKLRGVYSSTADVSTDETVEIRLRFDDDVILGGSKCMKTGAEPVIASGEAALSTDGLDAATGKVTIGELTMKRDTCEAGLAAATYNFKVEDDKLTLWVDGSALERTYKKVGD